jgi:kynurenine formamidase
MVLFHTGFGQYCMDCAGKPDRDILQNGYPVLDGADPRLLQWITDSGAVVIVTDNYAVEDNTTQPSEKTEHGPLLPLHEHCLFKLGVHLGEIWYLSELAAWLRANKRSRFMLTAPPLRLPGAVGSPATPVATV